MGTSGLSGVGSGVGRRPGSSPGKLSGAQPVLKRKRNPVEAAIVWGLIGALCLIALIELAGKLSYDRALADLQNGLHGHTRENPFTKDVALKLVRRPPRELTTVVEGNDRKKYEWKWFSIFKPKSYRIEIIVNPKDQFVEGVRTGPEIEPTATEE